MRRGRSTHRTNRRAWLAIDAQGLAKPRPKGNVGRTHLRSMIDAIGQVQLDAINVVTRTQFLVPFSRLGGYDITHLQNMTGPGGEWFEYWGHAASIMPVGQQPQFRWRMDLAGPYGERPLVAKRRSEWWRSNKSYVDASGARLPSAGALTAGQLTDPRRQRRRMVGPAQPGRVALEVFCTRRCCSVADCGVRTRLRRSRARVARGSLANPDAARRRSAARLAADRRTGTWCRHDVGPCLVLLHQHQAREALPRRPRGVGELVPVTVDGWRDPRTRFPAPAPARRAAATPRSCHRSTR